MDWTRKIIFVCVLVQLLPGCGLRIKNHRSQSGERAADQVRVVYDASVPSDQKELIEKDFAILADAGFVDHSENTLLNIPSFSNQNLRSWLQERYRYLVGESFDASGVVGRSGINYQPVVNASVREMFDPLSATTIMRNAGGGVYLDGKKEGNIYNLIVAGLTIPVTSPRVGIFQIGKGLFSTILVPRTQPDDDINSYLRLGTAFHEARHSDGNGVNAAFPHSKCPSGDYQGEFACDQSLDGAYPTGRVILQKFRNVCDWCSSAERANIDLRLADLNSRVLPGADYMDQRFERIAP